MLTRKKGPGETNVCITSTEVEEMIKYQGFIFHLKRNYVILYITNIKDLY